MEAKVILDTSVLAGLARNNEPAVALIDSLREKYELCTTDIAIFELFLGAYISSQEEKNAAAVRGIINSMSSIFGTSRASAEISGKLLAGLARKGKMIEMKDVLIAGICLENSCPIATFNKKHFENFGVEMAGQNGADNGGH